jgi:hypothetical protein
MRDELPHRGAGSVVDPARPVPPARIPLLRGGRPLKRWRYVGAYGPDFLVCAATVHVGPAGQSWMAAWDRVRGDLVEMFSMRAGAVDLSAGVVRGRGRRLTLDLRTDEATTTADPVAVTSPHGGEYIWTRKVPVRVHGTVTVDGARHAFSAPALIDDSAGYHARRTDWEWSAGVGVTTDGRDVVWNLVDGVHDAATASERTVWVNGAAHEVGPVEFLPGLAGCAFAEGGELRCTAESERARSDNFGVFRSDYRQPFGTFTGVLPGVGELAEAYGVMEEHSVRW